MRALSLSLGLVSLLFCAACGTNNGTIGFIPKGNFSNASLNGQYVYQIEGFDFSTSRNGLAYREAGVFTANGSGGITTVTDDFSEGSTVLSTTSTGSYAISPDGTGSLSFNNALGAIKLAVTLVSASKVYLVEGDTVLNAGGLAEKQDATAIATVPSGTFAFREHDVNPQSVASVGVFTISGGTVSSGSEDVNRGGAVSSQTFTAGSFNTPVPTNGRGTGTLTDSSLVTSSFIYYIVDANNLRLLASTSGIVGSGRAEKQSGTPALSGSYAFASKGDTASLGGINTAGRFTANSGTITAGARDFVQDGNTATNVSFTGTYAQAVSGRAAVTLSTMANNNLVVWMVSPSRGFFLVNDPNTVQDGTLDLQTVSTFSNSTMKGQYALVMDGFGFDTGEKDRVGTLQWDGSGKLTLNEFTNAAGVINSGILLSGNYSVSSNGRTTGSLANLSNNLVFYLISANDAYVVENDTRVEISGAMSKQQ